MKCATSSGMSSRALAQRRHHAGDHVQAVEEVLAEAARRDLRLQVAVGGGDDPHVDLDGLLAADALELLLLQHAQQLELQAGRHVADLVEEQGAAVGQLEPAELALDGAGEGALLVAEQLGLEQRLGQRAAVDLDERPCPRASSGRGWRAPPAPCRCRTRRGCSTGMSGGATFSMVWNSGAHRAGVPDDLAEAGRRRRRRRAAPPPRPRPAPGPLLPAQLQRALDLEPHHLGRERLLQEVEGAAAASPRPRSRRCRRR